METQRVRMILTDFGGEIKGNDSALDVNTSNENKKYFTPENNEALFINAEMLISKFFTNLNKEESSNKENDENDITKPGEDNAVSQESVDSIFGGDDDSFGFGDSEEDDDLFGDLTGAKTHVATVAPQRQMVTEAAEFNFDDFGNDFGNNQEETQEDIKLESENAGNDAQISNVDDRNKSAKGFGNGDESPESRNVESHLQALKQILVNLGNDEWLMVREKKIELNKEDSFGKTFSEDPDLEYVRISKEKIEFWGVEMGISATFETNKIRNVSENKQSKSIHDLL